MLIKLSIENFKSFDRREELSMISSSKIRKNGEHCIRIKRVINLLKHAAIYGANASGKSNLVYIFTFIQKVLENGLTREFANSFCRSKKENKVRESIFELQFSIGDKFYAYGFSAVLSKGKIKKEWLYELFHGKPAEKIFVRKENQELALGIKLTAMEKERFNVYSEDFKEHDDQLFLSEMNRRKKYEEKSKLLVLQNVFNWIMQNIIVITPTMGIGTPDAYYEDKSLENISELVKSFDTGISKINTKKITTEELKKLISEDALKKIFASIQQKQQKMQIEKIEYSTILRAGNNFLYIKAKANSKPEVKTLALRHEKSIYEFAFSEESDGTKRLFDLLDILLTEQSDTVFVVDELERSLHPKFTEHFLRHFMKAHEGAKMQMVFTTHENTIMDQKLFRRDEIWFVERNVDNATKIYPLDRFKERYDKKLGKAYLEGRYGAIPVFKYFDFQKGD